VTGPAAKVVVLISGRGSNMQAIVERGRAADSPYRVTRVFSDRRAAGGLQIARDFGVEARAFDAKANPDRAAYDRALAQVIDADAADLVVLAGFMRILSGEFVARFEGRMLNIHPSLLPKFTGLHTHRRALAAGEQQHGATVHFVTEALDEGPAVIQARVPILPGDDEDRLAARVHGVEHQIYPLAVRWFCERRLNYADHAAWLDGRRLETPVQWPPAPERG
jgi:phosphoribosylglycinamide formyltransferase 1